MSTIATNRKASGPPSQNNQQRPKKPQLTHFLCLPLVNAVSLPQLESSLATFKQTIPFCPRKENESALKPLRRLIPDGAVRPIGTLHLTLGVMSLTSKERLDEAVEFLQRLDLVYMMREAERIADANAERGGRKQRQQRHLPRETEFESASGGEAKSRDIPSDEKASEVLESVAAPQPFTVSLESLHALPRAKDATILHAIPVDPTSRLYPFCVMLRDKFLEAGFLLGEHKNKAQVEEGGTTPPPTTTTTLSSQDFASTGPLATASTGRTLPQRPPKDTMVDACNQNTIPKHHLRNAKPRPLLLHATVANTIYVKGRRQGNNNNNNGRGRNGKFGRGNNNGNSNERYSFDARDMLAYYRDYYIDHHRTQPRTTTIPLRIETTEQEKIGSNDGEDEKQQQQEEEEGGRGSKTEKDASDRPKYPFIWAKDFPLEKICICEMGAKKVDLGAVGDEHIDMAGRLGEQYRSVSERSLLFS